MFLLGLGMLGAGAVAGINAWVTSRTDAYVIASVEDLPKVDCVLILGARVYRDGTPSPMLTHRLDAGLRAYRSGAAPKILVSGDNSTSHYNEVKVMREWLVARGVPSDDVFEDHAGFSTYESMYRARDVFRVRSAIVVTQGYHEARALYSARMLGIDAYGFPSGGGSYPGQRKRDLREWLARVKDFVYSWTTPEPTYLGPEIPISGSGGATRG